MIDRHFIIQIKYNLQLYLITGGYMSISRRSFAGVGIGCSACALRRFPPGGAGARNPIAGINSKTTLTPESIAEMCFRCPIQAQVVNNKTVFIRGNPSARRSRGRAYARGGGSGVSTVNDPQRIVKPMKRTGPRGDGEWQVMAGRLYRKSRRECHQAQHG